MIRRWVSLLLVATGPAAACAAEGPPAVSPGRPVLEKFVESHCIDCHDQAARKAGLDLNGLLATDLAQNAEAWEKVVRKLTARQMPPIETARPQEREYDAVVSWLESSLDDAA